ncbi:GtrA family protein [Aurantivibrio infirmus]
MPFRKLQNHPFIPLFYQLIRYGLVGGVSTLIHIAVAISYLRFVDDSNIWSNVAGFLVAYCFSYTVQSLLVFRSKLTIGKAFRFFSVQVVALSIAILLSALVVNAHPYIKVVITAFLLPLLAFIIHKLWTFKKTESLKR